MSTSVQRLVTLGASSLMCEDIGGLRQALVSNAHYNDNRPASKLPEPMVRKVVLVGEMMIVFGSASGLKPKRNETTQTMVRVAVIAQTTGVAHATEQKHLQLSASDQVVRALRIRRDDHRILSYELTVLPIRIFPNLSPDSEIASDIFGLARDHGVVLGIATERARIVKASKDVSTHLGITVGGRVVKLDRVMNTSDGRPVEWRIAFVAQS